MMPAYEFIFSEKTKNKIARHLAFWLIYSVYIIFFTYDKYDFNTFIDARTYPVRFQNLFLFIPPPLLLVYVSLALLPQKNYSKNISKFIRLGVSIFLITGLSFSYVYVLIKTITLHDTADKTFYDLSAETKISVFLSYTVIYPMIAATSAISIKLVKNWYLKTLETEMLLKQKKQKELNLFKSKFHPTILLRSLDNIYKSIVSDSVQSPKMILYLSDLLDYILYQDREDLVQLSKELAIIKKYTDLMCVNKGALPTEYLDISGNTNSLFIVPLALLQFTESAVQFYTCNKSKLSNFLIKTESNENIFYLMFVINNINSVNISASFIEKELAKIESTIKVFYAEKSEFYHTYDKGIFTIHLKLALETALSDNTTGRKIIYDNEPV